MEVFHISELGNYGGKFLGSSWILLGEKTYRCGPSFSKQMKKQAIDFCRQLQNPCFVIEYDNYFSAWVQFDAKATLRQTGKKIIKPLDHKLRQPANQPIKNALNTAPLATSSLPPTTKPVPSKSSSLPGTSTPLAFLAQSQSLNVLDQNFIQESQAALIDVIGPIGNLFVRKVLSAHQGKHSQLSTQEFITLLCNEIPDPEKATSFRKRFIP